MQDLVETDPNYVPGPGRFTTVWNDITNQLDDMLLTYSPNSPPQVIFLCITAK